MKINIKNSKGFTLLETMVAISVLVTAIIGPFNLASQTIKAQSVARNNLVAANFAQEGLELFRNYRSNNILRNDNDKTHWLDGTLDCLAPSGCGIDVDQYIDASELPLCSGDTCRLYLNPNTGLFAHCSTDPDCEKTQFTRTIRLEQIDNDPEEYLITATVSWSDSLGSDSFSVSTHLLNW